MKLMGGYQPLNLTFLEIEAIWTANDMNCILCNDGDESSDHMLLSCYVSASVWNAISNWCNIPQLFAFTIPDLLSAHNLCRCDKEKKALLQAIIYTSCWCIWKERNEAIFRNKRPSIPNIIKEIKCLSFLWVKTRGKMGC
ncbi:toll/interleukin-1 receptor (TIR) domain-containing protein [Artemisia annua]|uniref:Toll/interleukin-1 receptor (TIR) domain-containing protein n=1 Tax=Artemisia annua TaxID=35608 RepID=A0A2U1LGT2_ARTAN|nr:toll/interleukin-1 receptor (TIR) domain-containing protein [Artemisia annua]